MWCKVISNVEVEVTSDPLGDCRTGSVVVVHQGEDNEFVDGECPSSPVCCVKNVHYHEKCDP